MAERECINIFPDKPCHLNSLLVYAHLELPNLEKKNLGLPVKSEFQINVNNFF